MSKLSACVLARDEAETLAETLLSVRDVVDEIVVGVDSRSCDDTWDVAVEIATDLFEIQFDNYGQAKNEVLDKATGTALMLIDGHERLVAGRDLVRHAADSVSIDFPACDCRLEMRDGTTGKVTHVKPTHRAIAVNDASVRFRGYIHESLSVGNRKCLPYQGIVFEHLRPPDAEDARAKQRATQDYGLLLREEYEQPENVRVQYLMAVNLFESGKHQAAGDRFHTFLKMSPRVLRPTILQDERYMAHLGIAECMVRLGRSLEMVRGVLVAAIQERYDRAEAYVRLGRLAEDMGRDEEAVHWYEIASMLPVPHCDYYLCLDSYGKEPLERLSELYQRTRQFDKATECGQRLARLDAV